MSEFTEQQEKDLREAIAYPMDWIYAHVAERDRPKLSDGIGIITGPVGPGQPEFSTKTSIDFRADGVAKTVSGWYDAMLDAVYDPSGRQYPNSMLADIGRYLRLEVGKERYQPKPRQADPVNPVGDPWPEQGPTMYHPVSGLTDEQLASPWTDDRGTFELRRIGFAYGYEKVS